MGKTMAVLENSLISNIIWCSDHQTETDQLKDPADRPVGIGDTYRDGKWYRDGVEILTPLEEALAKNTAYEAALQSIETAAGGSTPVSDTPQTIEQWAQAVVATIQDMQTALSTRGVNING